jgi:hypothetical protein
LSARPAVGSGETSLAKAPASAKAHAVAIVLDRAWGKVPVMDAPPEQHHITVRWIGESEDDGAIATLPQTNHRWPESR